MADRILVIEDDERVRDVLASLLEREGYVPCMVDNAEAGLRLIEQHPPDLILLDLHLPGMDGLSFCRRIKQDETTSDIPVVMMTSSYIDIYDVNNPGGPEAFVVRPFVREVLANVVERVLFRR